VFLLKMVVLVNLLVGVPFRAQISSVACRYNNAYNYALYFPRRTYTVFEFLLCSVQSTDRYNFNSTFCACCEYNICPLVWNKSKARSNTICWKLRTRTWVIHECVRKPKETILLLLYIPLLK